MINRFILFLLFSICASISYGQKNYYKPKYFVILDSIQGARLTAQCSRHSPDSITGYWTVTETDKKIFLNNFRSLQYMTKNKTGVIGRGPKAWKKYGFQIVGFKNGTKKYIYLNAFNIRNEKINFQSGNWKERPIIACGGGDWYWGAIYDMEKQNFIEVDINVSH